MSNDAEIFERTAIHDNARPESASEKSRIADTLSLIPQDVSSVLDVGCGPGTLVAEIESSGRRVYGTDLGRRGLRFARSQGSSVIQSALPYLPLASKSVHLVLCSEVLEHLQEDDLPKAVAELTRVAQRHVLITVPYREQSTDYMHRCPDCKQLFHIHGHRTSWTEDDLRRLFPPHAKLLVRHSSWQVRPVSLPLLLIRNYLLRAWRHAQHMMCPHCKNQCFADTSSTLRYRICGALNERLRLRRPLSRWIMIRADFD